MAQQFNLTAQINLQSPKNVGRVVSDIQRQLKGSGLNTVNIKVKADPRSIAQTNRQLQNIGKNSRAAAKDVGTLNRNLQEATRRFSVITLATGGLLSFVTGFKNATKAAIEFERELVKISQVTGKSVQQLQGLTKEVTRLSTAFGVSSADLLNVSRTLAQAGFNAEQTRKSLDILAKTTLAATFDNIQDTTEGAIALLRQFGDEAKRSGGDVAFLEKSLDAINSVSKKFAVESGDLITVIRRVGGVFSAAGGSVNELIALFTSVRATTRESAETIATGLRTIFTRIQRPETVQQLKALNIQLADSQGQFVGAFEAVKRLSQGLSTLNPRDFRFSQIVEELGGFRQIGKVIPLIQQFATAQQALNVAQNASGSTAKDAQTAQQGLGVQIQKVREEFTALIRKFTDSGPFNSIATGALKIASAMIKVAEAVEPLLPLLTTMFGLKLGRALAPGLGQLAGIGRSASRGGGAGFSKFNRGGMVPGSGNRDTVPAMLTPGEFVIRKSSVKKLGSGTLAAMNENRLNHGGKPRRIVAPVGGPTNFTHLDKIRSVPTKFKSKMAKFGVTNIERLYSNLGLDLPAVWNSDWSRGKDNHGVFGSQLIDYVRKNKADSVDRGGYLKKGIFNTITGNTRTRTSSTKYAASNPKIANLLNDSKVSRSIVSNFTAGLGAIRGKFLDTDPDVIRAGIGDILLQSLKMEDAKLAAAFKEISTYKTKEGGRTGIRDEARSEAQTATRRRTQFPKQNALGGLIQKFALGGLATKNRVGFAILDPDQGGADLETTVTRAQVRGAVEGTDAQRKALDKELSWQSKRYAVARQGLPEKTSQKFYDTIAEEAASGVGVAANKLSDSLGLGSVSMPEDAKQTMAAVIKKSGSQMGVLFEDTLRVMDSKGPFKPAPKGAPFDFRAGIQGALQATYNKMPSSFVDARTSYKRSNAGAAQGKIINELADEYMFRTGKKTYDTATKKKKGPSASEQAAQEKRRAKQAARMAKMREKAGFAKGGAAPSDTVPALLTPGEFVFSAKAAKRIGHANLDRMNKRGVVGFANGGVVGGSGTQITNPMMQNINMANNPNLQNTMSSMEKTATFLDSLGLTAKEFNSTMDNYDAGLRAGLTEQQALTAATGILTDEREKNSNAQKKNHKLLLESQKEIQKNNSIRKKVGDALRKAATYQGAVSSNVTQGMSRALSGGGRQAAAQRLDSMAGAAQSFVFLGAMVGSVTSQMSGLDEATKKAFNETAAFASGIVGIGGTLVQTFTSMATGSTQSALADQLEAGSSEKAAAANAAAGSKLATGLGIAAISVVAVISVLKFFAAKAKAEADIISKARDKEIDSIKKSGGSANTASLQKGLSDELKLRDESAKLGSTSALATAGAYAAAGAAIGSFIPGLGTAVGAAIGGIAGGLAGYYQVTSDATNAVAAAANEREKEARSIREVYEAQIRLAQSTYGLTSSLNAIESAPGLSNTQKIRKRLEAQQQGSGEALQTVTEIRKKTEADADALGVSESQLSSLDEEGIRKIAGDKNLSQTETDALVIRNAAAFKTLEEAAKLAALRVSETGKTLQQSISGLQAGDSREAIESQKLFAQSTNAARQAIIEERDAKVEAALTEEAKAQALEEGNLKLNTFNEGIVSITKAKQAEFIATQRAVKAQIAITKAIERTDKFLKELSSVEIRLDKQQTALDNFAAVVDNAAIKIKASGVDEIENVGSVKDLNKFANQITSLTAKFGPEAKRVGSELAQSASVLKNARSLIGKNFSIGDPIDPAQILNSLGLTPSLLGPGGKAIFDQIAAALRESKGVLKEEDIASIFGPLEQLGQKNAEVIKRLIGVNQKEIDNYQKYLDVKEKLRNREVEQKQKEIDAIKQGMELRERADALVRKSQGISEDPIQAARRTRFINQQARRAENQQQLRGITVRGEQVDARNVGQIAAIRANAIRERRQIAGRISGGENSKELIKRQKELQVIIGSTTKVLENFADSGEKAEDIFTEMEANISVIEKERQKREQMLAVVEEFVVGGEDARKNLVMASRGIRQAFAVGSLQMQSPEQRQATVGLLDQLSDVVLMGGMTGRQIKQELVIRDAIRMGLDPNIAKQLATATTTEQKLIEANKGLAQEINRLTVETIKSREALADPKPAGGKATGGLVQYRSGGGTIFKPKGTDTVPAMLTPGEFVIRKSAVDKIGADNLAALNNGGSVVYAQKGRRVTLDDALKGTPGSHYTGDDIYGVPLTGLPSKPSKPSKPNKPSKPSKPRKQVRQDAEDMAFYKVLQGAGSFVESFLKAGDSNVKSFMEFTSSSRTSPASAPAAPAAPATPVSPPLPPEGPMFLDEGKRVFSSGYDMLPSDTVSPRRGFDNSRGMPKPDTSFLSRVPKPPSAQMSSAPRAVPAGARTKFQTFTDNTGKFSVEARITGIDPTGTQVTMQTADGRTITVPISRLSKQSKALGTEWWNSRGRSQFKSKYGRDFKPADMSYSDRTVGTRSQQARGLTAEQVLEENLSKIEDPERRERVRLSQRYSKGGPVYRRFGGGIGYARGGYNLDPTMGAARRQMAMGNQFLNQRYQAGMNFINQTRNRALSYSIGPGMRYTGGANTLTSGVGQTSFSRGIQVVVNGNPKPKMTAIYNRTLQQRGRAAADLYFADVVKPQFPDAELVAPGGGAAAGGGGVFRQNVVNALIQAQRRGIPLKDAADRLNERFPNSTPVSRKEKRFAKQGFTAGLGRPQGQQGPQNRGGVQPLARGGIVASYFKNGGLSNKDKLRVSTGDLDANSTGFLTQFLLNTFGGGQKKGSFAANLEKTMGARESAITQEKRKNSIFQQSRRTIFEDSGVQNVPFGGPVMSAASALGDTGYQLGTGEYDPASLGGQIPSLLASIIPGGSYAKKAYSARKGKTAIDLALKAQEKVNLGKRAIPTRYAAGAAGFMAGSGAGEQVAGLAGEGAIEFISSMFGFSKGGAVPSYFSNGGPNQDTVPAMLTPGEFIMSASAVRQHGVGTMRALNRGQVPGFNRGGMVGGVQYRQNGGLMGMIGGAAQSLGIDTKEITSTFDNFVGNFSGVLDNITTAFSPITSAIQNLANIFGGSEGIQMTHNHTVTIAAGSAETKLDAQTIDQIAKLAADYVKPMLPDGNDFNVA